MLRLLVILTVFFGFRFTNSTSPCYLEVSADNCEVTEMYLEPGDDIPPDILQRILNEAVAFYSTPTVPYFYGEAHDDLKNGILVVVPIPGRIPFGWEVFHLLRPGIFSIFMEGAL